MLTHLFVQNFNLVKKLNLAFGQGLNIITGETGSGKSTLVKALQFLSGEKSSQTNTHVSATFCVKPDHKIISKLKKFAILCEDTPKNISVILRRSITDTNLAFCNDVPITLKSLKEISSSLLDISLQHEGIKYSSATQERLIDTLSGAILQTKTEYKALFSTISKNIRKFQNIFQDLQHNNSSFLENQLQKLKSLNLSVEEFETLKTLAQQKEEILAQKGFYHDLSLALDADDGILSQTRSLKRASQKCQNPETEVLIFDVISSCEELSFHASKAIFNLESKNESIEDGAERLETYFEAFHFFRVQNVEQLLQLEASTYQELQEFRDLEKSAQTILDETLILAKKLAALAKNLSHLRKTQTPSIESKLNKATSELGLQTPLKIHWSASPSELPDFKKISNDLIKDSWGTLRETLRPYGRSGAERPDLMLETSKGKFCLINEVASGGESSRLFFTLKTLSFDPQKTLVLDEVDAGVSGKVADLMGQKIKALSIQGQTICISHLPQVVVYADHHHKMMKGDSSSAKTLTSEESLADIAVLLSGKQLTKDSLANAKSLKMQSMGHS